ncbi:hypothetical protein PTSG_11917 [Salpingoeca rosetta]|uniref:Cytochrome c oxidase assembly factor 3 n=1 Tax=Salpingoeca rosetta (strain ATCC 50818 / BSB-021) TaxID=946362 RepID=F2U364_SALR5|nr:uncharacterized protein PTSG_11917 [Salpingoeca rosetta]EGD82058.1 hypothetical protein PTSG_11917 [Salpingoeca rosetta]|eukprot:XP_004996241.1 hypothetical protein PTSG_11917 [Salpingoeca rosetta]
MKATQAQRAAQAAANATRPFRRRNLAVGAVLFGFVGSVYAYTILSVKQEDFSDVQPVLPTHGQKSR